MPRFKRSNLSVLFYDRTIDKRGFLACPRPESSVRITLAPNNDQIEVIGHIAFDGTGVTQVMTGEHWRKNYLYLNSAGKITVVDVTSGGHPSIASEYHQALPAADSQVQVIVRVRERDVCVCVCVCVYIYIGGGGGGGGGGGRFDGDDIMMIQKRR